MDIRTFRIWVYGVLVAAGPLVTFYGVASADEVALWLGLGGTLLGVPAGTTAIANITPKSQTVAVGGEVIGLPEGEDVGDIADDEEPDIDLPETVEMDELEEVSSTS